MRLLDTDICIEYLRGTDTTIRRRWRSMMRRRRAMGGTGRRALVSGAVRSADQNLVWTITENVRGAPSINWLA
jgi:predicted nucleic acid-binding protein